MTSPDPDGQTPPPADGLGGLDPKDLFAAGLETVPPITLPAGSVDPNATIPVARPQPSRPTAAQEDFPQPEELTALLPAGAYSVEGLLGQGGMGAVYKGVQVRLKRHVAIKIMRRDVGRDFDFEARFEREAQAMAKLNHPNIVSVIDYGEAGPDYLYIVMEFVDGADMMDVIRTGRMTQEMALTLLPQICDALQFAHDHGIVHRDIKPSNIMLTRDGRIKMADFGLAKRYDVESSFRTQTGTGMGTPDYAAPEQFDPAAQIDHRADIYALGVMIYQMITGQLPRGVWKAPSQRADIDPHWDDIVSRAMQSDPGERYQHASDVKTDVSSISLTPRSADTPVRPSSKGGEAAKKNQAGRSARAPLLVGLPVLGILGIGAWMAFASRTHNPPPAEPHPQAPPSKAATTSPTSSANWQPLVPPEEWRAAGIAGREFKDGRLHLRDASVTSAAVARDGAIRARFTPGAARCETSVERRRNGASDAYRLVASLDPEVGIKSATLLRVQGANSQIVVIDSRPKPLKSGEPVTLELRVQGEAITGLINGKENLRARAAPISDYKQWGIRADDAWFESVEVQPFEVAASAPEQRWHDWIAETRGAASFVNHPKIRDDQGLLHITAPSAEFYGPIFRNGRVRILCKTPDNEDEVPVFLRYKVEANNVTRYQATVSKRSGVKIGLFESSGGDMKWTDLQTWPLAKNFDWTREYLLEFAAIDDVLTVSVNGQEIGSIRDPKLTNSGECGFNARKGTQIRKFEYLPLDSQGLRMKSKTDSSDS